MCSPPQEMCSAQVSANTIILPVEQESKFTPTPCEELYTAPNSGCTLSLYALPKAAHTAKAPIAAPPSAPRGTKLSQAGVLSSHHRLKLHQIKHVHLSAHCRGHSQQRRLPYSQPAGHGRPKELFTIQIHTSKQLVTM